MTTSLYPFARRMAHVEPFRVMDIQQRAFELEAAGRSVIHMEIGQPDFAAPAPVLERARQLLDYERLGYTDSLGLPQLRTAIAQFHAVQSGVVVDPTRVMVTTGASGALMTLLGSLVNPGDEWLMPDPCYPCNRHMVSLFGGLPRLIPTSAQSQFQLSAATVREHWRPHTRGVLLASPSNPTGTRIAPDELRAVHAEVRANGGVLIVDEIYLGLTYGARRDSALALGEDVFVVSSFSKYFAMTGWRLGWLVAPPDAMRGLERFAQNATICPPALAQHAALAAFEPASLAICEARREEFQARRDDLIPALQGIGFKVPTLPDGAFYVYADCSALATDSARLARELLEAAGVALTPGDDFGVHEPQRWLRFAYTCDRTLLRQAVARLKEALPHIKCAVGAA